MLDAGLTLVELGRVQDIVRHSCLQVFVDLEDLSVVLIGHVLELFAHIRLP